MTTNPRNTEGLTPQAALLEDRSAFPPEDAIDDRYQAALLMAGVLMQAQPHLDMPAWLRYCHAGEN